MLNVGRMSGFGLEFRKVNTTNQQENFDDIEQIEDIKGMGSRGGEDDQARQQAERENAKRVMRESGLAEMLIAINKNLLKGRGTFEEFGSMVLFKWGTFTTRRHLWIEIRDNTIRFRLAPHLKCAALAPVCDGEYHTFTTAMWADRQFLSTQLQKYYEKPVAESSVD